MEEIMKHFGSLFISVILAVNLVGCAVSEDNLAQTGKGLNPTPTNSPKDISMKQDDNILSKNYSTAEKALNKAVLAKDKETIRLGLKSPIFSIKQKTVEAMTKINDKTFVPNLIEALEENQGVIAGGSEAEIMQQELNKAIISALEQLTGLQLLTSENMSADDIQRILNESREWWRTRQKEKQQ